MTEEIKFQLRPIFLDFYERCLQLMTELSDRETIIDYQTQALNEAMEKVDQVYGKKQPRS